MTKLIFQKDKIGLGKRKQAIARVFLIPGKGNLVINKISGNKYLQYNDTYLNSVWAPLKELNLEKQFDIIVLWHYDITTIRHYGITALWQFDITALRQFGITALWQFGNSAIRHYGITV